MPNAPHIHRLIGAIAMTAGLFAATASVSDPAQEKAMLAGELPALVYQASASACMINAGVDVASEIQDLAQVHQRINATLRTLAADRVTDQTVAVERAWRPLDEAISMILAGDTPSGYVAKIGNARPAMENAALLLADHVGQAQQYGIPATASQTLTVDLAERQEVLVHQMKLMACEMNDTAAFDASKAALLDTMSYYELSLEALTDGRADLSIAAPTDYATQQVLAAAWFDWQNMKPILATIAVTGNASSDALHRLSVRTDGLGGRMAELVDTYHGPDGADATPLVAVLD